MVERRVGEDRFNWRFPFCAAFGALILHLYLLISCAHFEEPLYLVVGVPIVSLVLLIFAIRKKGLQRRLSILSMLVVYWAFSLALVSNGLAVSDTARWFLGSKDYKVEVLAQPDSAGGELKHVEWDGWGFPGAGDTVVYLVFDPNDLLAAETKSHTFGKFSGIPCTVSLVRRLETHWYTIVLNTDADWGRCT